MINMAKQPMAVVKGTTNAFGLALSERDSGDRITSLQEGQILIFAVRPVNDEYTRPIVKTITSALNGEFYLELSPEDTANMDIGEYLYDISLKSGENILYNVIEASPFFVKPSVAQLGDGE